MRISRFFLLLPLLSFSACYDPVENLKPTTFQPKDLEQNLDGRVVDILALMPSRAVVDNSYNHYLAADVTGMTMGSLFTLGGAVGGLEGMALGWYLGELFGQTLGAAMIPPALYPKSLIIVFKDPLNPQIQQAVEIARPCEFKLGHAYAVKINRHRHEETRIQPNNFQACLKKAQELKEDAKEGLLYQVTAEDILSQSQFNADHILPPTGEAVILKMSNPDYHPHIVASSPQKSVRKPLFTKRQLRLLKKHRPLHSEGTLRMLTPSPTPVYHPGKTGKEQWQYMNNFGNGI